MAARRAKPQARPSPAAPQSPSAPAFPWQILRNGLAITIRAEPRARHTALGPIRAGTHGPQLHAAVTAAPEDGRANDAIARLLASTLGIAPSRVTLSAGATNRVKRFLAEGDGPTLAAILANLLTPAQAGRPGPA